MAIRSGPFLAVEVAGRSMLPSVRPGEWWVVLRTRDVRVGQRVVVERPDRPGLLVVKRAVRQVEGGWWVEGDNPEESDDSRLFGAVSDDLVVGRLWFRYRPLVRRRGGPRDAVGG
ncbi:MAG: S26 family signal peptidase [Candidatus Nanopelagicales bacterium]